MKGLGRKKTVLKCPRGHLEAPKPSQLPQRRRKRFCAPSGVTDWRQLFIVQFVGNISESLIADLEGKVRDLRSKCVRANYCTINGQDTARLLYAYGKLNRI
jgi:hypothetical protein